MQRIRSTLHHLATPALLFLMLPADDAGAIEVVVPNGGVRWTAGESRDILWNSTAEGLVHIEWTPNGGHFFWLTIDPGAPNTGSYTWLVPNVPSENAYVRITELNTSESDSSDTAFAIGHIPTEQSEGHLYLSTTPGTQASVLDVTPLVSFDWYVVTDIDFSQTPSTSGLGAWEASIDVPPEIVVTQRTLMPPGSIDVAEGITNLAVGTGDCIEQDRIPFTLVHYQSLLLSEQSNLEMVLNPSTPSSTDPPEVPAWVGCGITPGIWPYPRTSSLFVNWSTGTTVPLLEGVRLLQNRPNPFNPRTTIYFALPSATRYDLAIFDARGRLLRTFESRGSRGINEVVWDGKDGHGRLAASGPYYYRLRAAGTVQARKMVLSK